MKKLSELNKNEINVELGKPEPVEFDGIVRDDLMVVPIIVNGVTYPTDVLHFSYNIVKGSTKTLYKVDIKLAEEFKHKGIGYKIYEKFLMTYGNIVSPFSYRSNFKEITSIYNKLSKLDGITTINDKDFIFVCTDEWKSKYGASGIYGILKKSNCGYIL